MTRFGRLRSAGRARRLTGLLAMLLLVSACSGADSETATTTPQPEATAAPAPTTQAPATTTPTSTTSAAPTTTEGIDVLAEAEQLMEALYTNDVATIESLASERANLDFVTYFAGWVAEIEPLVNGQIQGWECAPTEASNLVKCAVTYSDDLARTAGADELTEFWNVGFAGGGFQNASWSAPVDDPFAEAFEAMPGEHPEWFQSGGPCDGFFSGGDPTTCAPLVIEFMLAWFAEDA